MEGRDTACGAGPLKPGTEGGATTLNGPKKLAVPGYPSPACHSEVWESFCP